MAHTRPHDPRASSGVYVRAVLRTPPPGWSAVIRNGGRGAGEGEENEVLTDEK